MFAKLLKYEWKASAGLLGILSGAALGIGLLGGLSLRYIFSVAQNGLEDDPANLMILPVAFMLMFMVLALVAYMFAVQIILLSRFYKSRFTDEGYLTFTLPVSTAQNYLSALTNILIWNVISGVVMSISMMALMLIGLSEIPGFRDNMTLESFGAAFGEMAAMEGYLEYQSLSAILGLVSLVAQPVIVMACITLGAVLAKKHKVLAAIGIYYGVSMAIGMVTSVGTTAVMMEELQVSTSLYSGSMLLMVGIQIAVQLVMCIGGSALSVWLMDKKLNLP